MSWRKQFEETMMVHFFEHKDWLRDFIEQVERIEMSEYKIWNESKDKAYERVVVELEKMEDNADLEPGCLEWREQQGYNQALSEAAKAIRKLKGE